MCWHASSGDVAAVDKVGRHGSSASSVADAAATAVDEVGRQADDAHSSRDAAGGRQGRQSLVGERERGLQLMLQLLLDMVLQGVGLGHGRAGRVDGLQLVIAQGPVGPVLQIGGLMVVRLGGGLLCALVVMVVVVMFEVLLCVLFFIVSVVVMLVAVIVMVQVLVLMIVMVVLFEIVVVPVVFVMDEPIAIILHFRTQARISVARFVRI